MLLVHRIERNGYGISHPVLKTYTECMFCVKFFQKHTLSVCRNYKGLRGVVYVMYVFLYFLRNFNESSRTHGAKVCINF